MFTEPPSFPPILLLEGDRVPQRGQLPGLEDVAPAPHQSPWRQARSVSPASFAAYAASLLLWQQRTAGKDGDGSEYRIGLRLWVLEERRNPPFCLLLLFGPVSLSCGSVVLNLPFFVSHSSLQPFTHISDFVLNLHAPCLSPTS